MENGGVLRWCRECQDFRLFDAHRDPVSLEQTWACRQCRSTFTVEPPTSAQPIREAPQENPEAVEPAGANAPRIRYRKVPVAIDAIRFDGTPAGANAVFDHLGDIPGAKFRPIPGDLTQGVITIPTLEGEMTAIAGDWILRGVKGECYPVKGAIFAETYVEAMEEEGELTLEQELARVLNRRSCENGSDSPDWVLAQFLVNALQAFNLSVVARERWYGRPAGGGAGVGARTPEEPPTLRELLDDRLQELCGPNGELDLTPTGIGADYDVDAEDLLDFLAPPGGVS